MYYLQCNFDNRKYPITKIKANLLTVITNIKLELYCAIFFSTVHYFIYCCFLLIYARLWASYSLRIVKNCGNCCLQYLDGRFLTHKGWTFAYIDYIRWFTNMGFKLMQLFVVGVRLVDVTELITIATPSDSFWLI